MLYISENEIQYKDRKVPWKMWKINVKLSTNVKKQI